MKNSILLFLIVTFFVSCGSSGTKKNYQNTISQKYITVVENTNSYSSASTEEGHTILFGKDSIDNYIVYFAKYDKTGKFDHIIKENIIMAKMDSSLHTLKSFITIYGGAFCDSNNLWNYNVYYYDKNMNGNSLGKIEVPFNANIDYDHKIKRILELLNVGYHIALSINNTNAGEWYKIVSALEPIQDIISYNVIENDTILIPIENKRIKKIRLLSVRLTEFHDLLYKKMNEQKGETNRHNDSELDGH